MKNKFYYTLASSSLFLNSSAVFAHTSESGGGMLGGLLHMFTGEHLLTLARRDRFSGLLPTASPSARRSLRREPAGRAEFSGDTPPGLTRVLTG